MLDKCHYEKEHTKPIFSRLKIMTTPNLYKYHCVNEFFKIIKFRRPYTLYESINLSNRDTSNVVILIKKSNTFLHEAAKLWNTLHKRILSPDKGLDTSLHHIKLRTKDIILQIQSNGLDDIWTENNFQF